MTEEIKRLPESNIENVNLYLEGVKIKKNKEKTIEENKKDTKLYKKPPKRAKEKTEKKDISGEEIKESADEELENSNALLFLEKDERYNVLKEAYSISIREWNKNHTQVVKYQNSIIEWKKKEFERESNNHYRPRNNNNSILEPLFLKEASMEGIQRIIKIIDTLFFAIEKLGGKVNNDFSVEIRKNIVNFSFAEGQDKVKHNLTKQEARQLVEYNDNLKYRRWASKPRIRKYDYIYNGKLKISLGEGKYIKDNDKEKIEDHLGEILICLYEKSEEARIDKEKQEEAHRLWLEEERKKEELIQRKEKEIIRVKELINKAEDYKIASEIRQYILAVEHEGVIDEDVLNWIEWAEKKADWFDPIKIADDEYLGKRQHEKSKEEKELGETKKGYRGCRW